MLIQAISLKISKFGYPSGYPRHDLDTPGDGADHRKIVSARVIVQPEATGLWSSLKKESAREPGV